MMLVLTRKKEEVIDIEVGGDIKISVKILKFRVFRGTI